MLDTIAKTAVVSSVLSMFRRYSGFERRRSSDYMGAVGLVLAGAAIGAGAALLFAPKPGVELRADVRRRARQLTSNASQKLDRVRGNVADTVAPQH